MERQGGEQLPLFSRCPECMRETSFLMARSYGKYEGVLRDLLHRFKFTREQELISVLGHCINEAWNRHFADRQIDWLVPVPVHPDRLRERGYNQAEMLALHLSSYSNIPVLSALQRTAHLKGQVTRDRQERLKALQSAYVCHSIHQSQVQEQRILLVDDIYTTGSTSEACARALRLAGATEVYVITVAR
ncbi:ComF family protein [Effusibacillus dendaii]|uniref:ComF family protein n=1 Tax=Effusibacillus dendaii TaxID=2743772 RepID=UPI00190D79E6